MVGPAIGSVKTPPGTVLIPGGPFILGSTRFDDTQPVRWNNSVPKNGVYFANKTVTHQECGAVMTEGTLGGQLPDFLVGRAPWGRTYVLGRGCEKLDPLIKDVQIMRDGIWSQNRERYEEGLAALRQKARGRDFGNGRREEFFRAIRDALQNQGNPAVEAPFAVYRDYCLEHGCDPVVDLYLGALHFLNQEGENSWKRVWDKWEFWLHRIEPRNLRKGFDHPDQAATDVSLYDAVVYCYLKGVKEGLDWRLSTEVEWEKAARGEPVDIRKRKKRLQNLENFFTEIGGRIYNDPNDPEFQSILNGKGPLFGCRVFSTDSGACSKDDIWHRESAPARGDWKAKNPLEGAPERMSGDVYEWTDTVYMPDYNESQKREVPQEFDRRWVLRGGSWGLNPDFLRAAYRNDVHPGFRHGTFGFRVALLVS